MELNTEACNGVCKWSTFPRISKADLDTPASEYISTYLAFSHHIQSQGVEVSGHQSQTLLQLDPTR